MKAKSFFLLFSLCLLPLTVAAADHSLTLSGFFMGTYDFSEFTDDVGETVEDNSFQVGKARLNIDFNLAQQKTPLLVHYRGDMETGSLVSKELFLEARLYKTGDVRAQVQAGLISSPCIAVHPPPETLETYNYPLTAGYVTLEEIGVRFDLNVKQFELKAAILNGNRREPRDDDQEKNLQIRLGWHPSWGMIRGFYMRETNGSDSLYGVRSEFNLPWHMKIRGSALWRYYDDEVNPDSRRGWNVLVLQDIGSVQLQAQYEQLDEDVSDPDYEQTERVTAGAFVPVWETAGLGLNYWENTSGPDEWGVGLFLVLALDPIEIWNTE